MRRARLPHINAMIVLNDIETAVVRAVMDGTVITAIRPAAVSLVAARRLARPGQQQDQLLSVRRAGDGASRAFAAEFPIREVTCCSAGQDTAEAFADARAGARFYATVVTDPRAAVEDQDISFPARRVRPISSRSSIRPGCRPALSSAASILRVLAVRDLRQLELLATDNHIQSREAAASGVISWMANMTPNCRNSFRIASGTDDRRQRAFFIHPGLGVGDVAHGVAGSGAGPGKGDWHECLPAMTEAGVDQGSKS